MIRFFRYLLLVLAGLFGFAGHLSATTVYPLQLNAQIIPPYSNCLGDMVAGNVTSIRVTGLLRDLKAQSYNVGIGMQVYQGSQLKFATKTNHTEVVTNNTIHNFNLKDLFSPNNITGRYDGDGYCLKEGGYEFVFQAFDGGNARLPLSEPVRIHVYLSQAEPPRIIAPANGECVNYNAPVNFVWMEGAVTSYNPNRSYRLEIVELPEHTENFDAKSYINNNSTKITVEGIPGNLNFYTFQNTAGKLVKGRSYLWRVQLYDKTQMVSDARTVYSTSSAVANGGYSEVYTFKYTNCDPFGQRAEDQIDESKKPEIIRVDSSEALSTVVWKNDPENFPCGYIVCFNRADDTLSNWARVEVGPTDSTYTFKNVENGVQYLTHIIGIVDCQEDGTKTLSANSDNGSFTLPVPEEQECSTTIDGLTSQYSVENLKVNDYFTANDRNIKINKIERFIEGGDTTFSGEGQVLCPWFPTISLTTKFEKVKINRNYELVKGVVYVPTDSSNCGFFDLDEMMNDEYTGDGPAEEMSDKFKEYTSTDEIPEGELGVVNGELYAKVNGQAVDLGKVVPASDYEKKIQKGNIDAKLGIVDFEAVSYWNPPYDGDRENYSGDIDKYYTNYSTSSGNYTVPWFAMASGSTSDVKARLQINDNFPLDKLKFVCLTSSQAVELNAKKDQDIGSYTYYKLPIFGGEGETSLNLYAVATDNDGYPITLGRAQILSMPKYEQSVVLIPVKREASSIDQASIEKKLNEIYSPLGITYKVTVADKFDSEELDFMKDGLEVEGSGYLSTETNAMKQLKNLYAQSHTIEKDAAYIFVCPKAKYDGAEVKGDMPRSGQTGYVFSTAEKYDDGWTVAHELGHGLYSFDHTFPNKKQGTTDNLMDYANGTNLKVWQWNLLYSHKDFTTPFLESDEDGMAFGLKGTEYFCIKDKDILKKLRELRYFYAPDGTIIDIKDYDAVSFFSVNDVSSAGCVRALQRWGYNFVHDYAEINLPELVIEGDIKSTSEYEDEDYFPSFVLSDENGQQEFISTAYKCSYIDNGKTYVASIPITKLHSGIDDNVVAYRVYLENGYIVVKNSKNEKIENYAHPNSDDCSEFNNEPILNTYFTLNKSYSEFNNFERNELLSSKIVKQFKSTDINNYIENNGFLSEELKDKLYAYKKLNGWNFYVIPLEVDAFSSRQSDWNSLAKIVFEELNLGSHDILITIPYLNILKSIAYDTKIAYCMPGLCIGSSAEVDIDKLKTDYDNTNQVIDFINDVFTHTKKKLIYINHEISYNGILIYYKKNELIQTGYSHNYLYELNIDNRFETYKELIQKRMELIALAETTYFGKFEPWETYDKRLIENTNSIKALIKQTPTFKSVHHGLNELYGMSNENVCYSYTKWFASDHYGITVTDFEIPEDRCFYGNLNKVQHEKVLSYVDAVGIALSPIGLDVFADIFGGFYCLYKEDYINTGIYASSLFMPFLDAKYVKTTVKIEGSIEEAIKGLRSGDNIIIADADKQLKIVSKQSADKTFLSVKDGKIVNETVLDFDKIIDGYTTSNDLKSFIKDLRTTNISISKLLSQKDSWAKISQEAYSKFQEGCLIAAGTWAICNKISPSPITKDEVFDIIEAGVMNITSTSPLRNFRLSCETGINVNQLADVKVGMSSQVENDLLDLARDCGLGIVFEMVGQAGKPIGNIIKRKLYSKLQKNVISKIDEIEASLLPSYVRSLVNFDITPFIEYGQLTRNAKWQDALRQIVKSPEGATNIGKLMKLDFNIATLNRHSLYQFDLLMNSKMMKSDKALEERFLSLFKESYDVNAIIGLICANSNYSKNLIEILNDPSKYKNTFSVKISHKINTYTVNEYYAKNYYHKDGLFVRLLNNMNEDNLFKFYEDDMKKLLVPIVNTEGSIKYCFIIDCINDYVIPVILSGTQAWYFSSEDNNTQNIIEKLPEMTEISNTEISDGE